MLPYVILDELIFGLYGHSGGSVDTVCVGWFYIIIDDGSLGMGCLNLPGVLFYIELHFPINIFYSFFVKQIRLYLS